eukprot:4733990-Prorocentrum_lima.AAC.1
MTKQPQHRLRSGDRRPGRQLLLKGQPPKEDRPLLLGPPGPKPRMFCRPLTSTRGWSQAGIPG